jgi:hypothetical protein
MSRNNYSKTKGRREGGGYIALPHSCLVHPNFIRLTSRATKLIIDIASQYKGTNNGDLTTAFSVMQKRGWKSKETLQLAINELVHYGWITRTRIGGLNRICNLYALTYLAIDECGGKLDVSPTITPPKNWNQLIDSWEKPAKYQAIDSRRKNKVNEMLSKKSSVRKPYLIDTEPVPITEKRRGSNAP